jgi:uncharacterized protein
MAGVFVAEGALHPARRTLSAEDENRAREMMQGRGDALGDVSMIASDGARLNAWSIQPTNARGGMWVLLLHGLGDNRMGMLGYAEMFLNHGFSVLLPDARAHGASGGQIATYGLLEADDIHRWSDWILNNQHPKCLFGFAESMGAAELLQSLRTESRFCAVAVESPFSSFREISYDRIGQFFDTGPWLGRNALRPVIEVAFAYARWKYGLHLGQLSPEDAVAATHVPLFLIHGQSDSNIPVRHSRRIVERSPSALLWLVPNADHCGAITVAREEFESRVVGWFNQHSSSQAVPQQMKISSRLFHILGDLRAQCIHGWKFNFIAQPVEETDFDFALGR